MEKQQSNTEAQNLKAWVVFSAQADMPWLKILKPGFRHCSVILNDGKNWIGFDPLSNYTDISVHHVPVDFNLPLWMRDRGHTVISASLERPGKPAPWGLLTCVEAVKRVLGIHKRFILTPWQLYRHLSRRQNINLFQTSKGEYAWEV